MLLFKIHKCKSKHGDSERRVTNSQVAGNMNDWIRSVLSQEREIGVASIVALNVNLKPQVRILSWLLKLKIMEKLVSIKVLRPIILPIIGVILITYIIVAYIFDLEM